MTPSERQDSRRSRPWLWLLVVLALLVPRLGRMAAPRVHFEDDNYLYSAFLIHRGEQPYRDFVQANPPLLEQAAAPFFTLFGATHRVGEGLSALALLATAIALWRIGRGAYGGAAGVLAGILYSWMPLGFRYHLFEREVFSLCAAAWGVALVLGAGGLERKRLFLGGFLCGLAFHCKQVGVFPGVALTFYLLVTAGWRHAAWIAVGGLVSGVGLLAVDFWMYGPDVYLQSFALHFIKGAPLPFEVRVARFVEELGPFLPLALLGVWVRRREPTTAFLLLWGALELAFMLVLSQTFWPHYMIPLLGPLMLLSGGALAQSRKAGLALLLAGLVGLGIQSTSSPVRRLGFGGVQRVELTQAAQQVQSLVPRESRELVCPPILALEADRLKRFNYIDTLGFTRQLQTAYREGRLRQLLENQPRESFSRTLGRANATWLNEAVEALRSQQIRIVVPEGELPISAETIVHFGYRPIFQGREFVLYAVPAGN